MLRLVRSVAARATRAVRIPARTYYASSHVRHEPMHPIPNKYPATHVSAEDAIGDLKSNDRVFVMSAAGTPRILVEAMTNIGKQRQLQDVEVVHIHTEFDAPYMKEDCDGIFRTRNLFTGPNARKAIAEGRADYVSIFLSEIPLLFHRGVLPVDVALVTLSPPDSNGFCSMGTSVDITRAALQCSKRIIAVINPNMPRTFGDGAIHMSHLDAIVHDSTPLPEMTSREPSEAEEAIGQIIAENLVKDGATLQTGIGAIPDSVLRHLKNHRELGVHTEMFSDGVIDLVERGVITNGRKEVAPGYIVSGFAVGTKRLFNFMNDNPALLMKDIAYTNDTTVIRRNPGVTAINSAIEVDLSGQVVSDSIGNRIYSGVGGQVDFIRGAALCPDGVPIIALPSVTRRGESRITGCLQGGGGVVTTRAHVHYVVTEFGFVQLWGKTMSERAKLLIDIAHPDHREALAKEAFERMHILIRD